MNVSQVLEGRLDDGKHPARRGASYIKLTLLSNQVFVVEAAWWVERRDQPGPAFACRGPMRDVGAGARRVVGAQWGNEMLMFWLEALRDPRRMGSLMPSSNALGVALAREVVAATPGMVIEIGAGTGAITRALWSIRDQLAGLSIIEKSPLMARSLSRRYPGVTVEACCASKLADMDFPDDIPITVVSSLPFRSLPGRDVKVILGAVEALGRHSAGFRLIQYSYFSRLPFDCRIPTLAWRRRRTVLANMPPATIWVLEPRSSALRR